VRVRDEACVHPIHQDGVANILRTVGVEADVTAEQSRRFVLGQRKATAPSPDGHSDRSGRASVVNPVAVR
jgi:hypothetical protein